MMRIALFGNTHRTAVASHIAHVVDCLQGKITTLLLTPELLELIRPALDAFSMQVETIESDDFSADLALSIGGDGTFLTTASRVGDKGIPILGINAGRLGFLADVAMHEVRHALEAFACHDCTIEERTLLRVDTSEAAHIEHPYALNDVAILKQDSSSMINITAALNGELVHTYMADGLLVSTPTGSTAYSLSVGGPIVMPQVKGMLLSPIASHSLSVRPLLIPDTWNIDLKVDSRNGCYLLSVDGRHKVIEQTVGLRIRKADFAIRIVRLPGHTFFGTLKSKLMWGVDRRTEH